MGSSDDFIPQKQKKKKFTKGSKAKTTCTKSNVVSTSASLSPSTSSKVTSGGFNYIVLNDFLVKLCFVPCSINFVILVQKASVFDLNVSLWSRPLDSFLCLFTFFPESKKAHHSYSSNQRICTQQQGFILKPVADQQL